MLLKDKVAIVTGSAKGIGKAYALRFAQEGAKVTVCDILDCTETAKEIEAVGGEVLALKTDVCSEESTVEMAKKTVERFGRIDILANNASIYVGVRYGPWHDVPVDEWDKMMAVNVRGVWLCCKAVFPYMKEQGKGKIINISSASHYKATPNFIHYATSKAAVDGFTRLLAREVGPYNISVNSFAPGIVMTKANLDRLPPERIEKLVETQCIKRTENPEDLTGIMVFLASDDSDFITGQSIVIDGGAFMH